MADSSRGSVIIEPVMRRLASESGRPAASFERDARAAMERFRAAAREVVVAVLGTAHVRAADLAGGLGLDNRLAWKLVKILSAEDVLAAAKYLPGERGVGLFLDGATQRGAPEDAVRHARRAFDGIEEIVREQAGNRRSFNMMVAGHAPDAPGGAGLEHRKGAFEHNGYIWGVQARVQIHSYVIQPSGDGENLDIAVVRGFAGLRRVRPQVPWRISRFYSIDEAGRVRGAFEREPLDPACGKDEAPLLRRFCSKPLPAVRRQVGQSGIVDHVLADSDVGNAGSVTCLTGEVLRRAEPCHPVPELPELGTIAPLRTPCEALVMDVFLHRGFFGVVVPRLRLLSDLFNETLGAHYTDADRLPAECGVERLSDGPHTPPIREFRDYADVIAFSFDRLGWERDRFSCYRVRLPYPPIPASLIVDFPLPARG